MKIPALICAALITAASPAAASEVFGGAYVHDVKTPLDLSGVESGADLMAGWRGNKIAHTPLRPYVFGAVNTAGATNYAAVGLSAKFGRKLYVRPGLGLAIHTGSARNFEDPSNDKIEFGSRILFEPELGIGTEINDRLSVEVSLVHMSHAQIFGRENPGIDNLGVRLNLKL